MSGREMIGFRRVLGGTCRAVTALLIVLGQVGAAHGAGQDGQRANRQRLPQRGPYLQNLQADRITVCWQAPHAHVGRVRLSDAKGQPLKEFATKSRAPRHEVTLDGLVAGQHYHYEVVIGEDGRLFGQGTIQAAPAKGKPFSFVAWGDSREGDRISAALSKQILKTGAGMCIHSGDLVNDGKHLDQWDRYLFRPNAALLSDVVLWPCVGNHDTGMMPDNKTTVFAHLFALPGKELFYSFDYGDAHFIVLDTTGHLADQAAFIEEDLAKTDAKWKFAAWHHPPFTSGGHTSYTQARDRILPILARHNVDMIIVGHNHHYMLSKPFRHLYEPKQKRPYVQLVTGGGGAQPAGFDRTTRWFGTGIEPYHFVLIEVDGDRLTGQAIDTNGRVLHRFEIDRTSPVRDFVAFELVELERYLENVRITNTNLDGWPTGLVLPSGETSGRLVYPIRNPLREPIRLNIGFDDVSAGLTFDPERRDMELAGGQAIELEATFRVTSPRTLYPVKGPSVAFKSALGSGKVRAGAPPVALGRRVTVPRTSDAMTLDGKADESTWAKVPALTRFVKWAVGDLEYESPIDETALRAVHDHDHLYLLLHRPVAPAQDGQRPVWPDTDHYSVFLASPTHALGIRARVTGAHSFEGTKGIDNGVAVAHVRNADGITWEMRIPLATFRKDLTSPAHRLVINVMEQRGNTFFTLAPTFRQHPNRDNSATLNLE